MEELLELAKKVAEEAEVFSISRRQTDAVFEANRLKQVQTGETSGRALRLIKEGRLGLSASNRMNGTKELVEMASEVAQFGAEAKFRLPELEVYPKVEVYDGEIEAVTEEQMVELGQDKAAHARAGLRGLGIHEHRCDRDSQLPRRAGGLQEKRLRLRCRGRSHQGHGYAFRRRHGELLPPPHRHGHSGRNHHRAARAG